MRNRSARSAVIKKSSRVARPNKTERNRKNYECHVPWRKGDCPDNDISIQVARVFSRIVEDSADESYLKATCPAQGQAQVTQVASQPCYRSTWHNILPPIAREKRCLSVKTSNGRDLRGTCAPPHWWNTVLTTVGIANEKFSALTLSLWRKLVSGAR